MQKGYGRFVAILGSIDGKTAVRVQEHRLWRKDRETELMFIIHGFAFNYMGVKIYTRKLKKRNPKKE